MGIDKFEDFSKKLNNILDDLNSFCASIESENTLSSNPEIDSINYSINFLPTSKVKGDFLISGRFLSNMIAIVKNQRVIYHSHVTDKIIGYAHDFCDQKCMKDFYKIPVMAHNQFRLHFFLFLKGIRPSVWETSEIAFGGRNPTDVNFAIIRNQIRFIDTVKYFQQSLGSLADSMTA